ncbi:MAG: TlpA family protein disulfide reductase [Candidatus Kapabacteria bacterium]|nr:TlpA family protein disulfide reductase [Ignavibacteriota bacterium]MCW5884949.1 TlpA family protein disulfide reductase [Candidatus Kapabacteria bacterium]
MKKIFLLILAVSYVIISCSSDEQTPLDADPKEFFIKANQSSLKVEDASFTTRFVFQSPKENFTTDVKVQMLRDPSVKTGFLVKFLTEQGAGLYDGQKYYFKSDSEKIVYISGEGIEPDKMITQNWLINPMTMIMLNEDYTEQIKARTDELFIISDATFSKYKTDVVESLTNSAERGKIKIRTYFDRETNLPVKEVKTQTKDTETIIQTFEILDLEINKGLSRDIFKLQTPADFVEEIVTPNSRPKSPMEGQPASDFTLKDLDGKNVTLSQLKGNIVILDFWGTWCHWCVKAMPKLQNVHEKYKGKNVIVLGISCNEREGADPKKFLKDNNITYNSLVLGEQVASQYGVTGFPTLYVISKDGTILTSMSGYSDNMDTDLINLINENL